MRVSGAAANDCVELTGGTVMVGSDPGLPVPIPPQTCCVTEDQTLTLQLRPALTQLDNQLVAAALAPKIATTAHLRLRSFIPWLESSVDRTDPIDASGAVVVTIAPTLTQGRVQLAALRPSPTFGALRRVRADLQIHDPTQAHPRVRIAAARLSTGATTIGTNGVAQT